jgi:PAS domain S-box-containing protein
MLESTSWQRDLSSLARCDHELHHLLETLPAAAYLCDPCGLITYYNQRAVHLWGRAPALHDAVDRWCGSFKLFAADGTPIPHAQCWMALALRDNREYNGREIQIERPDGTRCSALAHANPMRDEEGRVIGAVNVLIDISDRKSAEAMLREADRRKNEFLAMLAHELRNPLAPITTALEILVMAEPGTEPFDRARAMMKRQVHQLTRLVDDLLDVTRVTSNKLALALERVDLGPIVREVVEASRPAARDAGLELCLTLPERPLGVLADPVRLHQVVSNLLNNAVKFTPRGGRVTVLVEARRANVVVRVRDTGIGIARDMLPRIFDMFAQAGRPAGQGQSGLGIGLALVRALVDRHGGRVEARSEGADRGSEFIVRLPLVADPSALSTDDEPEPASRGQRRVLIVDDHPDAGLSLAMLLRLAGNETRAAHDGLTALEEAERFRPDVVLLDIGMPEIDGYETCRRLRERPWGGCVRVIALTGWGQEEDRARAREAGFDGHLVKPVDPGALMRLIAETPAADC